jgi:DivIVA domain-containing protein
MRAAGLDPGDLYDRVFTRAMRGYATEEVDAFLRDLGDELDRRHRGFPPRRVAEDVRRAAFSTAVRGYAVLEVDDFLDMLAEELERLEEAERASQADAPPVEAPWPETPGTGAVRFTLAMRGYATEEVDAFLDRAARELDRLARGETATLTAAQVRGATFSRVVRGYAMPEVETYLEDLGREYEQLAPPPVAPPPAPALDVPRQFPAALRGYAVKEVDDLMARIAAELDGLREALAGREGYVARLTARDVEAAEFNRGLRGYAMPEVDDFLDEAAEELARLQGMIARWPGR